MKKRIFKIFICMLFIGTVFSTTIMADSWNQMQKLLASDDKGGNFGQAISISEDTVLIGASLDDDNGVDSGSAYVFIRTGTSWVSQQKLLTSDGATSDWFGCSVSIDGNYALIGADGDDDKGQSSGSAYVFIRTGNTWAQQAKLLATDGKLNDKFGKSVSIYGNTSIIGTNTGSVYVFTRDRDTWTQQQKLLISDSPADDNFGCSISIDGNTAIIGADGDDDKGQSSGSAYVFIRTGNTWTQQAKLLALDGSSSDNFGYSVALSGDTALIGAYHDDDKGDWSGSAYVFTRTGTNWTQQYKLLASDGANNDCFGWSVSISDDTALIGAQGDDVKGDGSGSAYIFTHSNSTWTEQIKLHAFDGAERAYFGTSVALSINTAFIGAPGDNRGSVYIFLKEVLNQPPIVSFTWTPPNPEPNQTIVFDASTSTDQDGFIRLYEWDWDNDGIYDVSYIAPTASHLWTYAGNYPVKLRLTDNGNATSAKTINVAIVNIPNPEQKTPGYEFILLVCAITLILFIKRKKIFKI